MPWASIMACGGCGTEIMVDNCTMAKELRDSLRSANSSLGEVKGLPAHQVMRRILLQLFAGLEVNRPGVVLGEEAESLHDFRVAVRRTRAALGQLRGLFPQPELDHFRGEFQWLGIVTGPTRDLDVYLQTFPASQDALPLDHREDLTPLRDLLLVRRREAHRVLAGELKSRRYRSLVRDWKRFLTAPEHPEATPPNALVPFAEVAGRRIHRLFARVLAEGEKIDAGSPPTDFHALRIRCKKLRYLLEFYRCVEPTMDLERLIGELKALQDNLGAFQDLTVQIRTLSLFAEELVAGLAPARTRLALRMLIERLERRRATVRGAFTERFSYFARKRNRRRFQDLFSKVRKKERRS